MAQTPQLEIGPYVDIAQRRKWWIILPFILSIIGGVVFLTVTPKTYKASTLILLEPQSIPDSFVRSTVTETMEGRLRTMTEQIQSRTNLERIIRDFQLDWKTSLKTMPEITEMIHKILPFLNKDNASQVRNQSDERVRQLRLVDGIRNNLKVTMRSSSAGAGQNVAFEVSFEWPDPEVVAAVTNSIAARFIEENVNAREEMAMGTTDFLDQEASALRGEIEIREKALERFKKEHMGMLPDQLESNINILNQLGAQLQNLEKRLDEERQRAIFIRSEAQLVRTEQDALVPITQQKSGKQGRGETARGRGSQSTTEELINGNIEELERELKRLNSFYTDKHPDIIALKRRIDALRKDSKGRETPDAVDMRPDTFQGRLNLQLAAINVNIESYGNQIKQVEKEIQTYKQRVERTPEVEMELSKVLRDYQTVRQRYDTLLSKKMDAKLAEQMERRKKGEQFKVLDPAIKPSKPFKPDAMRVMAIALGFGLGLGVALAYLREMLDPSFYNPGELEDYLDTKIMVSLPLVKIEESSAK